MTPQELLEITDLMRRQLHAVLSPNKFRFGAPSDIADLKSKIEFLDQARSDMLATSMARQKASYKMSFLIDAMLLGGYMKSCKDLKASMCHALRLIIPKAGGIQDAYLQRLQDNIRVPGGSVLLRNRLTIHMGFCQRMSEISEKLLEGEGCVRWSTMDASPMIGYEWLLSGLEVYMYIHIRKCMYDSLGCYATSIKHKTFVIQHTI